MTLLDKAQIYEQEQRQFVDPLRPAFHMTPPVGWMNDPNGFSTYQGEYHLFFQYYPHDTIWGPMHWGHAKTTDFIKWDYLPTALAPEAPYDELGCFSGSAIELEDGRQMLFYTGVTQRNYNPTTKKPDSDKDGYQNQCLAFGDGINYTKYKANPILVASTAPEGGKLIDFRDPKIWKEDHTYYALISYRPADGSGDILLYQSQDALSWEFISVFFSNANRYGKMWECPDFFSIDGQDVLLASPMEMEAEGLEFHAGYNAIACIGVYDKAQHIFCEHKVQAIDYGLDFYSTQTLETADGRRIMLAWMQNWATQETHRGDHLPFFGQTTIPRELYVKGERLIQQPVREMENYRKRPVIYQDILLTGSTSFDGIAGRILDLTVTLRPVTEGSYSRFSIRLAQDDRHYFLIEYIPDSNLMRIDRSHCGSRADIVHDRAFYIGDYDGKLQLRILLDKYSVELFVNGGEQTASSVFYTDLSADGISFETDGQVNMDLEKYELGI